MSRPDKEQLVRIVEQSEIALWRGSWKSVPRHVAQAFGMRWLDRGLHHAMMTDRIPAWFFNRVIGLGLHEPVSDPLLDELVALYHSKGLPIGISLSPLVQPDDLGQRLMARGFKEANRWAKMFRPASPPKPVDTDLRIEVACDEHAQIFGDIIVRGFELSESMKPIFSASMKAQENRAYIAWDGDVPVGAGMLTLCGDVGHLNTAATLPGARGRGAQGAIMARRIQDGISAGCRWFATETWVPGDKVNHSYNNMLRHGFELAYERPNLVLEPAVTGVPKK